jgi:hypothetical protein
LASWQLVTVPTCISYALIHQVLYCWIQWHVIVTVGDTVAIVIVVCHIASAIHVIVIRLSRIQWEGVREIADPIIVDICLLRRIKWKCVCRIQDVITIVVRIRVIAGTVPVSVNEKIVPRCWLSASQP